LRTADFLSCETCGVYVGAVMERFCTVNANTFEEPVAGDGEMFSYEGETAEERVARRRAGWTPILEWLEETAALRGQLLAMAEFDETVRGELAADGSLFAGGYHPRMEHVHLRNAARLERILDDESWPRRSVVGEEAAAAAWLVVQHAISRPDLMRRGLALLSAAAVGDEASRVHAAMLEDRVLSYEGMPQKHGTQYDWDEDGMMSPLPYDDGKTVDERRRALALRPLAEETKRRRAAALEGGERAPSPGEVATRRAEREAWVKRVGWR
jgi:hypothetical protein